MLLYLDHLKVPFGPLTATPFPHYCDECHCLGGPNKKARLISLAFKVRSVRFHYLLRTSKIANFK